MLNMLIINAVNRGMLTALCAVLYIILFWSFPGTLYFSLGLVPSSKCKPFFVPRDEVLPPALVYMNSALATLNTRQHIIKKSSRADWRSIQLDTLTMSGGQ
ncbi:hypothetical protein BDQ17DRAFT_511675 [Cyathus striatus]|nr:hypothetical protein BDQ17DRAFT_511675 [Cyathus striatus]